MRYCQYRTFFCVNIERGLQLYKRMIFSGRALRTILAVAICVTDAHGYSVLSHEAIVDAMWDVKIKPILLKNYPTATPDELKKAHGFAYGGAIIQDLGYYPHSSARFSDLTHYVRTGDFIASLIRDSDSLNDLAFALGALSHYVGDMDGHRYATNVGEPILYPEMKKKFGPVVTYEDNPSRHLKTEFGFDVLEVARANFAPQGYHDLIGFYVAKDLLERAFHDTYGLDLKDVFFSFDLAVSSYRSAVSRTIPMATRIAWAQRKDEIQRVRPGATHRQFVYLIKRSNYEKEWGQRIDEPNGFEKFLGWLLKLLPPIGPLKALHLKMPTPQVEQLFMASFDRAVKQYTSVLDDEQANRLKLENANYDVGEVTPAGVYRMDDDTQAFWLHKLAEKKFATVTPEIKKELESFYSDLNKPIHTKQNEREWGQTLAELKGLKEAQMATAGQ